MKDLLKHTDGFAHGRTVGIRTEIAVFPINGAAIVAHTSKRPLGNFEVRIAFIVSKKNVVLRIERLDEIIFKQQRFGFGTNDGRLKPGDFLHHQRDARTLPRFSEIAGDAALEVTRFTDVQTRPRFVKITVDTGQTWQAGKNFLIVVGADS